MAARDRNADGSRESLDRSATERSSRRSRAARAAVAAGGMASLAAVLLGSAAPTVVAAERATGPASYSSPWTAGSDEPAVARRPDTISERS
jgi:hypothetical protein